MGQQVISNFRTIKVLGDVPFCVQEKGVVVVQSLILRTQDSHLKRLL